MSLKQLRLDNFGKQWNKSFPTSTEAGNKSIFTVVLGQLLGHHVQVNALGSVLGIELGHTLGHSVQVNDSNLF